MWWGTDSDVSTEWDESIEYEEVLRKTESVDYYRQASTHHRFAK